MAYSSDTELLSVLPLASSYVAAHLTASTEFERHRVWASNQIDNQLKGRVSVPVTVAGDNLLASGLAEVEAYYTAYRLLKQNIAGFGANETIGATAEMFLKDANEGLQNMYIPASYDTPTQLHTFTGNGTIAVVVYDQFTYTADWVVKCINTSDPTFSVWNNRRGFLGQYDLNDDAEFPDEVHQQGASEKGLIKEVNLILATGATAFALGDTWAFRTYGRYRANSTRGFGSLGIVRE